MGMSLDKMMDCVELGFNKIRAIDSDNATNAEILKRLQDIFKENKVEIIYKENIKKKVPEYIIVKIPVKNYNEVVNNSICYRINSIWDEIGAEK